MDKSDGMVGICGNKQFADHLYRYGEISNEIKAKKQVGNKDIAKDITKSGMHRVASINICLSKIKSTAQGTDEWETYFNYIRWNQNAIVDELQSYLEIPCMEKHRGTISACLQLMNYVVDEFCKFTVADGSIISEYKHVYDMISDARREPPKKVISQAGRLFVNFVDILIKKFYYIETADIKFADVDMEAGIIVDKLNSASEFRQAETVKSVHEHFVELRKMRDGYRLIQKDLLKKALKLAHARATENILQAAKRFLLDAISMVQKALRDGLQTAVKIGEALVYPIMHPVETAKSIWYAIRHPVESVKALGIWAKENPWKCCAIVAGGLCLGAFALGGAAILFDIFIYDITATIVTPLLIGSACGGVVAPLAVAANRVRKLVKRAEERVSNLKNDFKNLEINLEAQGEDIATSALDEHLWCIDEEDECAATPSPPPDQHTMSKDELQQTERELMEHLPAIEDGLRDAQSEIAETTRDMSSDQQEASVIQRASEILKRRISESLTSEQ